MNRLIRNALLATSLTLASGTALAKDTEFPGPRRAVPLHDSS